MCGKHLRAQILILNYPSYNRSCWTGQTGWTGAQWVELLGKYVLICLCAQLTKSFLLAQAQPWALWGVMGKGRRKKLFFPAQGTCSLPWVGAPGGAACERMEQTTSCLPCSSQWCCSFAQDFPALALQFPLNEISGKVSELLYDGSMRLFPGGIVAITSRAGSWGFGESVLALS